MIEFVDNHSKSLRDVLKLHLSDSTDALFALAFIRQSGLNMIVPDIEAFIQRGGKLTILFANDFGATEAEAVSTLKELGVHLRFFSKSNTSFHVKAYLFKKATSAVAIIGSSNLSASGLTTGAEWSLSASSDQIDFASISLEFQRLWDSDAAHEVTEEIVSRLANQPQSEELRKTIHQEDRYPTPEPAVDIKSVVNNPNNYVVRRKRDNRPNWFFQVYKDQLNYYSSRGPFNVVAVCNSLSTDQVVFSIPYSYLRDNILPFAHLEANDRYLFNINKTTLTFNWSRGVKMDGHKFILK